MIEMFGPSLGVNKYVIKEDQYKLRRYGQNRSFITLWNVVGALVNPNGMTKNS